MSSPSLNIQQAFSLIWKDTALYKIWAPGMPLDLSFEDFWMFFRTGQFPPNILTKLTPEMIIQTTKAWTEMSLSIVSAKLDIASVSVHFNAKLKELFPGGGSHE